MQKTNTYELYLQMISAGNEDEDVSGKELTLHFDNHDDIFSIIERLREKDLFNSLEQATEFAIGLKMFSEVMIKNRQHPLFEELQPAFSTFMQKLKTLT